MLLSPPPTLVTMLTIFAIKVSKPLYHIPCQNQVVNAMEKIYRLVALEAPLKKVSKLCETSVESEENTQFHGLN